MTRPVPCLHEKSATLMESNYEKVLALLERHISSVNARAILDRALKSQGLSKDGVSLTDLRKCAPALGRGVSLFLDPAQRETALRQIKEFCGGNGKKAESCSLDILAESDISRARAEARKLCEALGTSAFTAQKVATIVSELARNMVLYAGGGVIEMLPSSTGNKRVVVRAIDKGPGIRNLEEVMSGGYRSKTGLGRGILGTQRLADRLDIDTGSRGTRIVAEVSL